MKLSLVSPVRNEEGCIQRVLTDVCQHLAAQKIVYEWILVNDNSSDRTPLILEAMAQANPCLRVIHAASPNGFGRAIRRGLDAVTGEAVVIFMGDGSDDAVDVVRYLRKLEEGFDCVFGSRFMKGSNVDGYPKLKLLLNRLGNKFIQLLFMIPYNDVSNAFKGYRVGVIRAVQPLVSMYFNITVEIPLKALVRNYSYAVIPINWNGRESGVSKYHIRELSKKYFFSILYVWLEKLLLSEDIRKRV